MTLARITGASSGIGLELAHLHAESGDDLFLIARRETELEKVKKELESAYSIRVDILSLDLSLPESAKKAYEYTQSQNITPDFLVNNAGFGGYGNFWEQDWKKHADMIQVNMVTLTELTYLYLPDMIARGSGRILQVASTAGMVPGPLQAVYHATKAYVLSISQALAKELEHTGITVTALCPGPVETGFAKAANTENTEAFKKAASVKTVAKDGFDGTKRGDLVVISGLPLTYRILMTLMPFLPRRLVLEEARKAITQP